MRTICAVARDCRLGSGAPIPLVGGRMMRPVRARGGRKIRAWGGKNGAKGEEKGLLGDFCFRPTLLFQEATRHSHN